MSIGDIAASGGYYIATAADYIFVDPMSVTGSTGVFATLPNAKGLLDKVGISAQSVQTHSNAWLQYISTHNKSIQKTTKKRD